MKFIKLFRRSRTLQLLSASLLPIVLLLSTVSALAQTQQNILFLPLKITSLSSEPTLPSQADFSLSTVLSRKGYSLLERVEAEKLLDYQGQWPPSQEKLTQIEPFSEFEYLALGNLTEIGGQLSVDFKVFNLLDRDDVQYFSGSAQGVEEVESLLDEMTRKIFSYGSKEAIVSSISPAGNRKIDSGAILKNILTKPGDPYNHANLRRDLKSIFKMGYFDDIQIEVSQEPDGKKVTFRVIEKPVIRSIIYSGIEELKQEDIKAVVTTLEQSILNPTVIKKDIDAIELLYKSKGYYNTNVESKISYPTEDSAELRFAITEGKKIYIKEIAFEGNKVFDDDDLEDEIQTNTKGWFSWITDSGLLDYDKLNQDAGRILNFYGNNGFLEAKIGDPVVTQEEEWLFITFNIEEGTRFRVGEIDIEGDLLDDKETILPKLDLPKRKWVSRKVLREDILKITDIYAEQGYANANIRPNISKGDETDVIDITIRIDKGELVYINRINISGNSRTRDNVIRRELKVQEGGIFNAKALRDSLQKLQYLDFFEEVSITPEKSFDAATVDLSVEVKDKPTGQFTIGAGYSSVDDLLFMGEIAENNFLGRGDTLALSANVGGSSNRYNLKYRNPRFNDSLLSWGFDVFDTRREYDDYTRDATGGSISFGYPIWEKWRGYGSYRYTDTTLSDVSEDASFIIRNSQDINITSALELSLQRDTRNKRFGATKGSKHMISVDYAGGPFGGDSEFTKLEGSTSWYFPLVWSSVFHFNAAAGQAFENENNGLPVYERFYLGGLNSIRGFDSGKVSPTDPETGERIGGDKMWFTNFELIFPVLTEQGVNGVLFYDMGRVFNDDEDWAFDEFEKAVGLGIRWFSPMGPLRLEWGYNLDPADDEDESVWDFSIGGVF